MRTRELTVEELMSTALVTARADEVIANVDFEMKMADIRHIPVVDDRGRLVGIVSQRDILRARVGADSKAIPIRSLMTRRVRTIAPDALALEAVDILLDHKIGCVPVVAEDGRLVGIVTETDFLRVARDGLSGSSPGRDARRAG